jgi:hypothetical protein
MAIPILNAIETVYENCSVYQSIVIVKTDDDAQEVLCSLLQNDYPVVLPTEEGILRMMGMRSRVLVVCIDNLLQDPELIEDLRHLTCVDTIIIDDEPPSVDCVQELVRCFPSAREIYVEEH